MKLNGKMGLLIAGAVIGAVMITPAGAHISSTVGHLWNDHIKGEVTDLVYTKAKANDRFLSGTWKSFDRPFQQGRQAIGGPFSVFCPNDAEATLDKGRVLGEEGAVRRTSNELP